MVNLLRQPVHVVLIDDDEVDAEAVMRLLQQANTAFPLTIFRDGEEARHALAGTFGARLQGERHLFLLDINMPRMNGFEFLAWLRHESTLPHAIVFVFSTSAAEADCRRAYACHIAGYLAKSQLGSSYDGLLPVLTAFHDQVSFPPDRQDMALPPAQ
jgi:DNA-binding NarL/FixJ family response regulator